MSESQRFVVSPDAIAAAVAKVDARTVRNWVEWVDRVDEMTDDELCELMALITTEALSRMWARRDA